MKSGKKALAAAVATIACAGFAPAANAAVTGSVTGDAGTPVALTPGAPLAIRNMDVQALTHVDAGDAGSFSAVVVDQNGTGASTQGPCWDTRFTNDDKRFVDFHGDLKYSLVVKTFTDRDCATAKATTNYDWTVGAAVAVGAPAGTLMTRPANSFSTNTQLLDFVPNPGAGLYEIKYALNGTLNPDGSLGGAPKDAFVDPATGKVSILERTPGTYLVVARAKSGDYYTPWSAPVTMRLIAPFDFSSLSFPDSIGPSYQTRGVLGETSASGRVSIAYAVGKKGKHFHGLGSAKINSKGAFTRRFRLTRTGWYRLRFKFHGSATVAGGTIYDVVRIRRHRL